MLYGPPGTGKTFACRYVRGMLPGGTRIMVTGSALFHMKAIVQLARALQPSLLILEDVDLVFMAREAELVKASDGTTQAFLKEWVHRAVQFTTERLSAPDEPLELSLGDFQEAMAEMKEFARGSSGQVVGFRR